MPPTSAAALACITPEILEQLLEIFWGDDDCEKKFQGREEELLRAAAEILLEKKRAAEKDTAEAVDVLGPFDRDVAEVEVSVERYQIPQTYSTEERRLLDKGHEYAAAFHEQHEDSLKKVAFGHKLATGDVCDTGQEVLARGNWEVRATPEELIAFLMAVPSAYDSRSETGKNWNFQVVERVNDHSVYTRTTIPFPYPLRDREYVSITLWERMESGGYFVCQTTTTHPDHPPADGVVQMDISKAFTLHQSSFRRTSVEIVAHMDMGGRIPGWVNTRITIPTMKTAPISGIQ
jgi:hypothetical protein